MSVGEIAAALEQLVKSAQAVADAVRHDDIGKMVAGQWMGGNGGLLSRETIAATDKLRRDIVVAKALSERGEQKT